MIVVADTTPLNDLILVDSVHVLPGCSAECMPPRRSSPSSRTAGPRKPSGHGPRARPCGSLCRTP